jgi:hypothetical protein
VKATNSSPERAVVAQRWRNALLTYEPNLPRPVVDAMVENVAQGPIGEILRQVEEGMFNLETVPIENLTGSEAKTILAILGQMGSQVGELQTKIQQLWDLRS